MNHFKCLYEFGPFRLDPVKRLLLRSGQPVPLRPKVFDTLLVLVQSQQQVVEKDEMLRQIWGGTVVEEAGLTRNISALRKVLGETPDTHEYVVTIPGCGYRFVAPVREIVPDSLPVQSQESEPLLPNRRWRAAATIAIGAIVLAAALLILWAVRKPLPSAASEQSLMTLSPLTSYPGVELDPAFSPDGNRLAFAWDGGRGEGLDIYVKTLPDGDPIRLTSDTEDERSPAWSPDGRYIAFIRYSRNNGGVFVVPASGGAGHKVADCPQTSTVRYGSAQSMLLMSLSTLAWMPDSKSLAFSGEDPESGGNAIYVVSRISGQPRRLTSPGVSADDNFPAVSPGGRLLAFVRSHRNAVEEIHVVPVTGGESRRLTGDFHDTQWLTWTRDGMDLLTLTRREGKPSAWWRVALAGAVATPVTALPGNANSPSLSPTRNQLAYAERAIDTNIWRFELNTAQGVGSFSKLIASTRQDHSPEISPDGRMIAFISNRTGQDNIWVCDRDDTRAWQITSLRGAPTGTPRWSPDGTHIAFDSTKSGKADIYIVSREGGPLRQVTNDDANDRVPSWSRDGNQIYFRSLRNGENQVWKIPVRGGQARQMTHHGGLDAFESPDGKFLYFTRDRGPGGIWRIPVDGGEEKPVPELTNAGYWRYWAVRSNGLYFISHEGAPPYPLKVFDFGTGKVRQLAVMKKEPLWWVPGLSIAPDGRSFLYAQLDASGSDIMMLDDFR